MENLPELLKNNSEFMSYSPDKKTKILEYIADRQPEGAKDQYLRASNNLMEEIARSSKQGRIKLDDRIQSVLLKVLPPNFNSLEKHEKLRAIDHAIPVVNESSQKIDPVNRNDTAYYVKDHLIEKIREIRGKDVGVFSDLAKRYYGQGYSTLSSSFDELATKRFLAECMTTNPSSDSSAISMLAIKAGKGASYATPLIVIIFTLIMFIKYNRSQVKQ